ncbi:MAG: class I SAM-dependent methyltransferase [candidate division KSB1 bacterium]|nr:class I SAM-dependent methyltransferase [candidate division KSB1 bacterium]MDZ7318660.1 class I SAM-dependent methyltransferase [candidate division KSB1 bacterium]MDZ7342062.1 class I SAM-dependent methyltransferase [candidate division KSB1 bacterium]
MVENRLTRQYFNDVAEQWKIRPIAEQSKITTLLSRIDWQQCRTVLDIGCGTGVLFPFIEKIAPGGARIFAMDFAKGMIREAALQKNGRLTLLCGCARYLPFRENTIDRIIAFHVLPHIQGKRLALTECWRILKPYGELAIIHLHSSAEINAIHQELGGIVKDHKLPPVEQVCRMLTNASFTILTAVDRSGEYFVRAIKAAAYQKI